MSFQQKPHQNLTPSLNFKVFFTAYNQRKLGNLASFLLVSISHLQINIFLFQSCMNRFPSDNFFITCINAPTKYLYIENYLTISHPAYISIRSFAWALSITYLISFLASRYKISHHKKSNSLEKIFTLLSTYFPMVFFLPILEILSKDFLCQKSVLEAFEHQCFQEQHRIIAIVSALCAAAAILMTVLTIFFSQNGIYDKKNYLSGNNRGYEALLVIIKLFLTLIVTHDTGSERFETYYSAANLALSLLLAVYFLLFLPYNKLPIEKTSLVWIGFYFAQSLAMVITRISGDENFLVSLPFVWMLLAIVFGNILLYNRLKAWYVIKEQTFSSTDFLRKVQTLLQLNQIEDPNSPEEIYFRGVVARHISSCRQIDCFCKQKQLFDPKKNKTIEFEKWPTAKSLTLKHYLRLLFEQQLKKTPNDVDLLINYARFLFQKFRNIPLALIQLTNIINNNVYLYPHQRFKIFKLRAKIADFINSRNLEALEVDLQIENVIAIEERFSDVIQGLSNIIQSSINFWGYLTQKDINLDQIRSLSELLCSSVDNVTHLWGPLKPYLHKYKKLMYYYNWYLKEFLNKKTVLSEEGIDDLFEDDRYSIRSDEFLDNLKSDHLLFDGQTPILHMSGNSNNTGQIIKVNKAVIKTFGYAKEELEKSNVNILMPRLIGERHTSYITSFVKTGRTRALYKQRRTFAKNKAGYVMPIWILAKQINNLEGLVEYVGLIRPLSEKKEDPTDYILFNNFGEVGGLSKNIAKIFACTNIKNIQKVPFNIVLLAPKLIKYLYFKNFLLENSKELQAKKESEENRLQGKIDTSPKSPIRTTTTTSTSPTSFRKNRLKTILPKLEKALPFLGNGTKMHDIQEFLELDSDGEDEAEFLNEKMINFTLRLPEDLEESLKEFEEIRSRQKHSIIQRNKFVEVVNMTQMESMETQNNLLSSRETDRRIRGHFSSSKSTFDAYLAALKQMTVKIAKQTENMQIFRVCAEICTDSYGTDGDIIKYLKIKEIIRKTPLSSKPASTSTLSPPISRRRFSRAVDAEPLFSFREPTESPTSSPRKRQIRKSMFSKAAVLNIKEAFEGDTVPNETDGGFVSIEDYDGKSPKTTNRFLLKSQEDELISKSSVSSQGEGEEENSQNSADSNKMALINELKYNIMNQFQSIFHKEENGIIAKEFKNLNKLKWFFYIFFTILTPLALAVYFLGLNKSLDLVTTSVSNIYSNERLRRDFLYAEDAMLTIALYEAGLFSGLTEITSTELQELIENKIAIITEAYNDILILNSQDEFLLILYEYVPKIQETRTINYGGTFSDTITTENLLQKLINDLSAITYFNIPDFVRDNRQFLLFQKFGVDTFDRVLFDVSFNFFRDIDNSFDSSYFLLVWFAITICTAFLLGGIFVIRMILNVIQSLKQILISFTAIDLQTVRETEDYYQRLLFFFTASTSQFLYDEPQKSFFRDTEGAPLKTKKPKEKFQKKNRRVQDNRFLKKETRTILSYFIIGLLLYACLNLLFFLIAYTTIHNTTEIIHDAKELVKLDTTYTSALIGLKILLLDPTTTEYKANIKKALGNTLDSLDLTLSTEIMTAKSEFSDFVKEFLKGEICEDFKEDFTEPDQAAQCENLALGRLSLGLAPFHNYFSGLVLKILQLKTTLSDVLDINLIYEFGELIDIINEVFMERGFKVWKQEMQDEVTEHKNLFIGLIVGLVVLDAAIFIVVGVKIILLLQKRFLFFRRVYNKYMLTEALNKEKLIKAALAKYQLLNK